LSGNARQSTLAAREFGVASADLRAALTVLTESVALFRLREGSSPAV